METSDFLDDIPKLELKPQYGIRTEIINSYQMPSFLYAKLPGLSAAARLSTLGLLINYAEQKGCTGRTRRTPMDVDALVEKWHKTVLGLAIAHDKDSADRYEAAVEDILTPILAAPIRQVRQFYPKLLKSLKDDPQVPFLVWRAFEIWVEKVISKAPDEDIKQLKTDLAKEIAEMVEQDVKDQIPEALVRALQWRNEETLKEVKEAVVEAKAAGTKPRLRGRESCLFLEIGGTEDDPKVCVQI